MAVNGLPNYFITSLAQTLNQGGNDTTIALSNLYTLDGQLVDTADFAAFGHGILTIDPLNLNAVEFDEFTTVDPTIGTNGGVSGVTRGLSFTGYEQVSANAKFHPVGTPVLIAWGTHNIADMLTIIQNNYNTLLTLINNITTLNQIDASTTQIGSNRISFSPNVAAVGTPAISIANPAVVTLANHGYTLNDEIFFLNGTGMLPAAVIPGQKYYILAAGLTTNTFEFALTPGGTPINTTGDTETTGYTITKQTPVAVSVTDPQYQVGIGATAPNYVYGESITAGAAVYINDTDGRVYNASSAARNPLYFNYIGVAVATGTAGQTHTIQVGGQNGLVSFGTEQVTVTETIDQQQTAHGSALEVFYAGTATKRSAVQYFTTGANVGNISAIDVYFGTPQGVGAGNVTLELYQVNRANQNASDSVSSWGSLLGSVTINSGSIVNTSYNKFTFGSPITLTPRTTYMFAIQCAGGSTLAYWNLGTASNQTAYTGGGATWAMTSSTSFAPVFPGQSGSYVGALSFHTYYTLQQNYYLGNYAFLNDTPGTIGVTEGTNQKAIGIITSPTSMIQGSPSSDDDSGLIDTMFYTGTTSASYTSPLYQLFVPLNTRKIVVELLGFGSTGSGTTPVYFELTKDVRNSVTTYYLHNAGATQITTSWTGNLLTIPQAINASASSMNVNVYYYR